MSHIFVNQTSLRIQLDTDVNLTGNTARKIRYIKPDGTTGEWSATVASATGGTLYYDMTTGGNELDTKGDWRMWAYVTFSDGRSAAGDAVKVTVYSEGTT